MKIIKSPIFSDFIEYNANSRNNNSEDCVKRALCFALGKDYDEVSKELNAVKRKLGANAYNEDRVWIKYLSEQGYSVKRYTEGRITVDEFCKLYPVGTYVLEVGKEKLVSKGYGDHLCCILDGDLYDSWDSRDRIVNKWCVIKSNTSELSSLDEDNISESIFEYISTYVNTKLYSKSKLENLRFSNIQDRGMFKDPYTIHFQIAGKIPKDIPKVKYRPGVTYAHDVYAKLNPRLSEEQNIENLKKKVKQRVYDWWYNVNKDISDIYEADSLDVSPEYRGSRSDLLNVPEWARPLMVDIDIHENSNYGYKYEAFMKSLPGDPRGGTVSFYADTLTEFKDEFKQYKENFARYGYEY